MCINFYDAFIRHDADANLLLTSSRWANADHLFGLAAECALKAILLQQGIPSDNGDINKDHKDYRKHINVLWDNYHIYMQTRYVYDIPDENPFNDWDISQRYAPEGTITEQIVQQHFVAVGKIKEIIRKAELDGVIP